MFAVNSFSQVDGKVDSLLDVSLAVVLIRKRKQFKEENGFSKPCITRSLINNLKKLHSEYHVREF